MNNVIKGLRVLGSARKAAKEKHGDKNKKPGISYPLEIGVVIVVVILLLTALQGVNWSTSVVNMIVTGIQNAISHVTNLF